jgi:hypothetical protein
MKRADLEKHKGKKIDRDMSRAATPGRFGKEAASLPDRREQRKRDQELGLVPFAVKLDSSLVKKLHSLAQERKAGLNEIVGELLETGLKAK